jgi:hypothetical protein
MKKLLLLFLLSAIALRADHHSLDRLLTEHGDSPAAPFNLGLTSVSGTDFGNLIGDNATGDSYVGLVLWQRDTTTNTWNQSLWVLSLDDFLDSIQCGWGQFLKNCIPDFPVTGTPGGGNGEGGPINTGGGGTSSSVPDSTGMMAFAVAGGFLLIMSKVLRDRSAFL